MVGAPKVLHFPLLFGVHGFALKAPEALALISSRGGRDSEVKFSRRELCSSGGGRAGSETGLIFRESFH